MITKSKRRRLLLLNDLVVCVSVTPRSTEDFSGNERLTLKWTYPVSDIEVCNFTHIAVITYITVLLNIQNQFITSIKIFLLKIYNNAKLLVLLMILF